MINSLKIQGDGYLLNGISFVTKENGNIEFEEIKKFLAGGGIVDPEFSDNDLFLKAQADKIALIDSTTATNIEALVGDNNKQKDKLAESILLARLETAGTATTAQITRLNELQSLSLEVATLKANGNAREAQVSALLLTDFTTLAKAILAVEAI